MRTPREETLFPEEEWLGEFRGGYGSYTVLTQENWGEVCVRCVSGADVENAFRPRTGAR